MNSGFLRPTIIYACESGEYSDYKVDALFSTRSDADLFVKVHGGEVCQRVLDLDIEQYRQGMAPYWVIMDRNGYTRVAEVTKFATEDRANHKTSKGHERDEWIFYMWAKDAKHAVKIANERRTQLLATNRWYP